MFPYFGPSHRPRRTSQVPTFFDPPSYSIRPEHHHTFREPSEYHLPYPSNVPYYQPNPYHRSMHSYDIEAERQARAQQLRRQREERERELEREAELQRELSRLQHRPSQYNAALKSERARRLAQAQAKHRPQPQPSSSDDPQVQVTLPDGRRCVVPLSWARRMQAKHPSVLSDNMITKIREPSPSPPSEHDLVLAEEIDGASESQDSDFYAIDRSQEPYPHVLKPSPTPLKPTPPSFPPNRSRDELDEAARVIQKHVRLHLRLKHLKALQTKFYQLRDEFVLPSLLDLNFAEPPTSESLPDEPSKLAYNSSANRPVQIFEDALLKLQIELDGIVSGGEKKIKQFRKEIVQEVESELERIDRFKVDAWNAQRERQVNGIASDGLDIPTVEMADGAAPSSNDESLDKKAVADADSVMSEILSEAPSYRSSIFDDTPPRSPSFHEDYPTSTEDTLKSSQSDHLQIPITMINHQTDAVLSAIGDSTLSPPDILEDVIFSGPITELSTDELVIPTKVVSRLLNPNESGVVHREGDDIVLPLHEVKSSENLIIPANQSSPQYVR